MKLQQIYSSGGNGKMQVACFVSGSGTNARRIIERSFSPDACYEVSLIFSDVRDDRLKKNGEKRCKAKDIAKEFGFSYENEDIRDFYQKKGVKRTDLSIRPEFDQLVIEKISSYEIDLIALAGYMSITTKPLLDTYNGRIVNVHPADLYIMKGDERKYVGIHVVRDAILEGELDIKASTHIVREKVDYGEILIISEPVPVKIPKNIELSDLTRDKKLLRKIVDEHQDLLKERGDWIIFPMTIQLIAEGRFAFDKEGIVHFDGNPIPQGLTL
jgi:folate-dependent phosphoribosylglycinamide formyltransferase PurN